MEQFIKDTDFEQVLDQGFAIDVHKNKMTVCVIQSGKIQLRDYGTLTSELQTVVAWLKQCNVTHGAIESTGVYWIPIHHLLSQNGFKVLLANAHQVQQIPRKKTDRNDAKWLCKLLLYGLIKGSFIPDETQKQLRDLTRERLRYTRQQSQIMARILKILEQCNIKIRSVISNLNTLTGIAIVTAISKGETDIEKLVALCKGKVKRKQAQMREALHGVISHHERGQLNRLLEDLQHVHHQLNNLDLLIRQMVETHYQNTAEKLEQIAGIGKTSAQVIIAEAGDTLKTFSNADHFASWAGLAPGNNESAGKRKNTSLKSGNNYLRISMVQIAWSCIRAKDSYWYGLFNYLRRRMHVKKAIMAIARKMLKLIYRIVKENLLYKKLDLNYFLAQQSRRESRTITFMKPATA